jgi:hypothetical protein
MPDDLPKFPLTLYPPSGQAPFKQFRLSSTGRTLAPNFVKHGAVVVTNDAEEHELFLEGWSHSAAKSFSGDDLRKIAHRINADLVAAATDLRKAAMSTAHYHHMAGAPRPLNQL